MTDTARRSLRTVKGAEVRVPPHDLQAEESLLGAMLLSRDAIGYGVEICGSGDFYKPAHGHIFDAVMALYQRGEPADPVTVADEITRQGLIEAIGGPATLVSLQANTPATSNAARYAHIIRDHSAMRELIRTAGDMAELGYSRPADVGNALDVAATEVLRLSENRAADSLVSAAELVSELLDDMNLLMERDGELIGVPTGLADLDHLLLGLQPSTLVTLAARPAMGKTGLALGVSAHVAGVERKPTLVFSMEMSQKEIIQRLVTMRSGVDGRRIRTGKLSDADRVALETAADEIHSWPLIVDHSPEVSVTEMRAKARRVRSQYGELGLVVVDYLQLMKNSGRSETRALEVGEFSRGLKILARDLDVPVLALSQLSRNLEYRADKRPLLADLRESGGIEQDSDVVVFIYRDEVYESESPDRGTAELIVAKHRSGPIGTVRVAFIDRLIRFANMARM